MTTRFYEWGNQAGGTSPTGPSAPGASSYGPPGPFEGTVAVGNTTITFTSATKSVTVRNTHDSNNMEYSLDGGATWLVLGPYGSITETVSITSLLLRRVGGAVVTYEVVGVLTS